MGIREVNIKRGTQGSNFLSTLGVRNFLKDGRSKWPWTLQVPASDRAQMENLAQCYLPAKEQMLNRDITLTTGTCSLYHLTTSHIPPLTPTQI